MQAKYKDDLKKKMLYFSNVDIIEPTGIKWSSICFQRNNQTYRMRVGFKVNNERAVQFRKWARA